MMEYIAKDVLIVWRKVKNLDMKLAVYKNNEMIMEKRNILLSKSPVNILMQLTEGKQCLSYIARQTGSTFAQVHGIINIFEDYGYAESEIIGARRMCKLTEKGKEAVGYIQILMNF